MSKVEEIFSVCVGVYNKDNTLRPPYSFTNETNRGFTVIEPLKLLLL